MKALISPNEQVYDNDRNYLGQRIAQIEIDENVFEVAPPLYWLNCDDFVTAAEYYYDDNDHLIKKIFLPPPININPDEVNVTEIIS